VAIKAGFPDPARGGVAEFLGLRDPLSWATGRTHFPMSATTVIPELSTSPSRAFMPYPVSTLSPPIVPNDLTSFKTRGISQVERDLRQKLTEIREDYLRAIDHFNWNKLVYEAEIRFEPVVGETYYLYEMGGRRALSMISPEQWPHRHLATVRLNYDRQWLVVGMGEGIETAGLFGTL